LHGDPRTASWSLASPGKSIFLYNPPLIFALFGIPLIVRPLSAVATAWRSPRFRGPGLWKSCSGAGTGAGPRYLLFLVPLLLLPGVFLVDEAIKHRRVVVGALATAVFVLGIVCRPSRQHSIMGPLHSGRAQRPCAMVGAPDRTGNVTKPGHQEALRSLLRGFLRAQLAAAVFSSGGSSTGCQAHLAG